MTGQTGNSGKAANALKLFPVRQTARRKRREWLANSIFCGNSAPIGAGRYSDNDSVWIMDFLGTLGKASR